MNKKYLYLFVTFLYLLGACTEHKVEKPAIIPQPQEITYSGEILQLPQRLSHSIVGRSQDDADILELLQDIVGNGRELYPQKEQAFIRFEISSNVTGEEAYELLISQQGIKIKASSTLGLKYGLQSLRQLKNREGNYYCVTIRDRPRFSYRGLMLDVSRHFFPTDYIKKLLDEMARLKLNRFHWHLVDGGGWRLESKYYPLLTQKSAYRSESNWDKWWHEKDRRFSDSADSTAYGGYYTQEEIKDVVKYAHKLGITIIPEIELPGHSTELIHAYPELICPQATYLDASDVCIGNEATFTFFEKILDETMELFPSEYIHIGGDEAAMNHWGNCPRCKKRIKEEGLKDLHELQSYMIRRIERYLNSKGRQIIGWDEILMGGLAPNATVMSWRGEQGGIDAARAGHKVIMTPNGNLYLDYYQNEAIDEPRAIGGYVTMEKVYDYNPHSNKLSLEEQQYIQGVQANLWTEYVDTPEQASYMLFPRVLALAEVAWTELEKKDYNDFRQRATNYLSGLEERGHNIYPLTGITAKQQYDAQSNTMSLELLSERSDAVVRYSFTSSPKVTDPILAEGQKIYNQQNGGKYIYANTFIGDKKLLHSDRVYRLDIHKGLNAKVHYHSQWNNKYPANGTETLKDGLWGSPTYLDGRWQGFTEAMDVVFELGEPSTLSSIDLRFMAEREQWVYMPKTVEVLLSQDGTNYESLGIQKPQTKDDNPRPVFETFSFRCTTRAKFVRVKASIGRSPGHFIFCDEVVIH